MWNLFIYIVEVGTIRNGEVRELKEKLKYLRKKKGWTQGEVAEKLGLKGHSTYSNWEYGRTQPDHDTLVRLAELFDVTIDYLLDRTDHPNESLEEKVDVEDVLNTLQQHKLTWDGKELSEEESKRLISIIRTMLS